MAVKSNFSEDKFEVKKVEELTQVLDGTISQLSVEMLREPAGA